MSIGSRIKTMRCEKGMTLRNLAERVGFSPAFLSRVENDKTSITLRDLRKVALALGVPAVVLLEDELCSPVMLVRATQRKVLVHHVNKSKNPVTQEFLLWGTHFRMEPAIIKLPPHTSSGEPSSHPGDEFTFVLEGRVVFHYGDSDYELAKGDTIGYLASISHSWENKSEEDTAVLVATSPATY